MPSPNRSYVKYSSLNPALPTLATHFVESYYFNFDIQSYDHKSTQQDASGTMNIALITTGLKAFAAFWSLLFFVLSAAMIGRFNGASAFCILLSWSKCSVYQYIEAICMETD